MTVQLSKKVGRMRGAGHTSTPDRPEVPHGRQMLFCVGAQKGGTTWLSENLARHPSCHFYEHDKELHYFDTAYGVNRGMRAWQLRRARQMFDAIDGADGKTYTDLLRQIQGRLDLLKIYRDAPLGARAWMFHLARGAGNARYLCDFTPDYANCPPEAFAEMASYVSPEEARPKVIYVMRDPVDRHWSFLRMTLDHRDVPDSKAQEMLARWLDNDTGQDLARRGHCDYRLAVDKIETHFPEDDRLILFFEDMFEQSAYDRVTDFLGIARQKADFSKVHAGRRHPLAEDDARRLRAALDDIYSFAFERWGDAVPTRWRRFS